VGVSIAFRLSIGISQQLVSLRGSAIVLPVSIAFRLSIGISPQSEVVIDWDVAGTDVSIAFRLSIGISPAVDELNGRIIIKNGSQSPFGCL